MARPRLQRNPIIQVFIILICIYFVWLFSNAISKPAEKITVETKPTGEKSHKNIEIIKNNGKGKFKTPQPNLSSGNSQGQFEEQQKQIEQIIEKQQREESEFAKQQGEEAKLNKQQQQQQQQQQEDNKQINDNPFTNEQLPIVKEESKEKKLANDNPFNEVQKSSSSSRPADEPIIDIDIVDESKEYTPLENIMINEEVAATKAGSSSASAEIVFYDYAITVLGYKLYDDGMPRKILKDRVTLASEHYYELQSQGKTPIIILCGKGKNTVGDDPAYNSEANAMLSLIHSHGVPMEDIHLDDQSTNTAENALNTLNLLNEKSIKQLIVITSDFHVMRTQYIFQTVIPSNIEIEFYGSITNDVIRKANSGLERSLYFNSQKDLDALDLLQVPGEVSWGYHPVRNLPRWRMIEREIEYDQNHFRIMEQGSYLVDYGSNQGYFSIHLAKKLPDATVISLEGEATTEYRSAAEEHEDKIKELNVTNNYLCRTTIKTPMFTELNNKSHVYEYQLCLSIFHWFGMESRESFEDVLYNQLTNAKTTFLELPEAMNYIGREGQHAWKSVNKWYEGRTEVEILSDIKAKYKMNMTWKVLGALMHDNKTVRKVIRVDVRGDPNGEVDDNRSPINIESIKSVYKCGKLMHK